MATHTTLLRDLILRGQPWVRVVHGPDTRPFTDALAQLIAGDDPMWAPIIGCAGNRYAWGTVGVVNVPAVPRSDTGISLIGKASCVDLQANSRQ